MSECNVVGDLLKRFETLSGDFLSEKDKLIADSIKYLLSSDKNSTGPQRPDDSGNSSSQANAPLDLPTQDSFNSNQSELSQEKPEDAHTGSKSDSLTSGEGPSPPKRQKVNQGKKGQKRRRGTKPLKEYICQICNYTTNSHSDLKVHQNRHSPEKIFKCDFVHCNSSFKKASGLKNHQLVHKKDDPNVFKYLCSNCSYKTARKSDLNRHIKLHLRENGHTKNKGNEKGAPKPFQCQHPNCSYSTKKQELLLGHTERAHYTQDQMSGNKPPSPDSDILQENDANDLLGESPEQDVGDCAKCPTHCPE